MADIRINALATTAASTASDDFIAVDGSANGTRKLNAYSPTFGGNLTASGTIRFDGQLLCGNAGGIQIRSAAGDANLVDVSGGRNLTMSGAATFGGNLTVSGTAITLSNTNSISLNLRGGAPGSSSAGIVLGTNASDIWTIGRGVVSGGNTMEFYASTGTPGTRFSIVDTTGNATLSGNLTVSGTGNSSVAGTLLVATTTNSSNGKLQLADHITSAGGIGFGTDTSLYRANAGQLYLDAPASTSGSFWVNGGSGNASASLNLYPQGTGLAQVSAVGANSLLLRTNNTTALTLDSSQNATFAKAVAAGSGISTTGTSAVNAANTAIMDVFGGNAEYISLGANTSTNGGHIFISRRSDGSNTINSLTLSNAGDATFAGATVNVSKAGNNPSFKATDGAVITKLQSQTAGDTTGAIGTESNHTLKLITNNTTRLTIAATGDATFTGAIAIGNTVNTVSPTSPNRTITMVIGGTTYYIHAKTTND